MENSKVFDLTFLGTCAYDFSPKLENEFKDSFDFDARRASAVIINDTYLIDCGNHILDSMRIAKKDIEKITDIFVTHLHCDHFNISNIAKIASGKKKPLRLWVRDNAEIEDIENVDIVKMTPYEKYEVGDGLYITGLCANHGVTACPQHLFLEKEDKKIFYGCDGAWMLSQTYNFLKKKPLDIAVLDCTVGDYLGDYRMGDHNSIPMIRVMLPSLIRENIITEKTKVYFSHIAPSLHKPHAEIVKTATEMGVLVAYDGLNVIV